jgi:hypothetical protein
VHGLGKGQPDCHTDKLDAPLSFDFLRVDAARFGGTCSSETKVDICFDEEAAASVSLVSKNLNEAAGSRSDRSSSRSKNEEAAESFLALLQTPEAKRRSLGSPGRAHGCGSAGRKEKEQCTLFSLLSLPAYHSAILGVRHQCYDL